MTPFGKILQTIYDSTLMADKGRNGCWVFASMVILSDKRGVLNIADRIFATRIDMPIEELNTIIDYLKSPDPKSNITEQEGRRIIPLSECDQFEENRGYFIVNKRLYAEKDSPKTSQERTAKSRKKDNILKLFSELGVCNVTETLPPEYVTILSISISISISLEVIKYLIESNIDLYAWMVFETYRKDDLNKPLKTDQGRKKLINFLAKYPQDIQRNIIKQSIDEEWKGLFQLKEVKDGNSRKPSKTSSASRLWESCSASI